MKVAPPFFIVGLPRSGTTLLQSALSAHSDVVIPPEEDLILNFYARFGKTGYRLSDTDVKQYVGFLFDVEQTIRYWKIDRQCLLRRLLALQDRTYRNVIEAVFEEFVDRFPGKSRWGCKAPYYLRHMDKIRNVFPDARFVHLIRDPRAVHASMSARRRQGDTYFTDSPWCNAWQWHTWVREGLRWSGEIPGRCLEVGYEQLVAAPQDTLASVCEFLEIPFQEQMLAHYESTTTIQLIRTDNIDRYLKQDFHQECIDAWQQRCTAKELRIVEGLAERTMRQLNYAPSQDRSTPPATLALACYRCWRRTANATRSTLRQLLPSYRYWLGPLPSWSSFADTNFKTKLAASLWRGKRSAQAS